MSLEREEKLLKSEMEKNRIVLGNFKIIYQCSEHELIKETFKNIHDTTSAGLLVI